MLSQLLALASLPFILAAPTMNLVKRDAAADVAGDLAILNYALTLEHLEAHFYTQGMNQYNVTDFTDANFTAADYAAFQIIQEQESQHVLTLTSVIQSLNGTAVPECVYNFPYTSVSGFVAISRALETTGVSAYTGAIDKIATAALVTAGATIATVEARHAAFLNILLGQSPFPTTFDTPLAAKEVVSIASQFITSCPYDLGVTPFPQLTLYPSTAAVGQYVTLVPTGVKTDNNTQFCSMLFGSSQIVTPLLAGDLCQVPAEAVGDVYFFLLSSNSTVSLTSDSSVLAGPGRFVVTVTA